MIRFLKRKAKRKAVQLLSLILINAHFGTLFNWKLYRGPLKSVCLPVLNCYSCPFALTSCPVGMVQQFLALGFKNGLTGFLYILGMLGLPAVFLGRAFCGWVCPFGFMQDLVSFRKVNVFFPRVMKWIKYILLVCFVLLFPLVLIDKYGAGAPYFCKYICPAGTLEAGIYGAILLKATYVLLDVKVLFLLLFVAGAVLVRRFYCRVCPLGLVLGFFNRISLLKLSRNDRCVECGTCAKVCPMGVNMPYDPGSPECIMCGKCVKSCPKDALKLNFSKK